MHVSVSAQFFVGGTRDLDEQTDRVMAALLDAEAASGGAITDADVSANLSQREVTVALVVDSDTFGHAERVGVGVIESAIISAHGVVSNETTKPAVSQFSEHKRATELVSA